jgi:undecaprenyl-diphosphatase
MLAAAAVAIAVAVALSRVLLDLHWISDVVGGLFLGWAWFALCSVVFGGRLLRPTAGVEVAAAEAAARSAPSGGPRRNDARAAKERQPV